MSYKDRVKLFEKIEKNRKRPLISYFNSYRHNASARMASDVIPEFAKQLNEIKDDVKDIDILIVSRGGDPTVSWRIISILRERFDNIGVLLPYEAYSAATLLALGADEILMGPMAHLSAVDTSITHDLSPIDRDNDRVSVSLDELNRVVRLWRNENTENKNS